MTGETTRPVEVRRALLAGAAALLVVGWLARDARALTAEEGLGYALGLAALGCMLLLLVYPLRKRLKILAFIGATKSWFRIHMILGTSMPVVRRSTVTATFGWRSLR